MEPLKLYVTGQFTPNREEWSPWDPTTIVLAHSREQAAELTGDPLSSVFEIPMTEPMVLLFKDSADERKDD